MSVISEELTQTLEQRLKTDAPHQFPSSGWDKIKFGDYYPGVDPVSSLTLIHVALGTVLGTVLGAHESCLAELELNEFFAGISATTTGEDAIDRMLLFSGMAVPRTSGAAG